METTGPMRMPTGIPSLDPVLEGGMPPGSVVLLLGDVGAGSQEFVYSSILALASPPPGVQAGKTVRPGRISYISFTKTKKDIQEEITFSFRHDMSTGLPSIEFFDLSSQYFDATVVPVGWYSGTDLVSRLQKRAESEGMLANLADSLNDIPPGSLIVLDSLTDLATSYAGTGNWTDLIALLRGIQRISKQWESTVYLLLTRGILDPRQELEIADAVDAVLLFRWEETTGARRQRVMHIDKFRGLMPFLEDKDLVKFAVRISSTGGFEVSNIRVVI
ncbi:KaiC/GvpD/RAD55 family RecA-like ATPase [Methanolinea mesophila]|uniref:RAD55 family ATPase n=1 Tax=Methanolinea mesophila TaxID=547055 RepID=UPI001AE34009|nr:RAD55 family ATPase [Methanolinea mesophila]MBP1927994.1 KaiC/GvpD/RAD55 family RecA-like ATPase [Methanolinea mesophila]